jgi:SSS family solute:Na+ symporter
VPNLTSVDWLILLLSFLFVFGIGYALRAQMKTARDFLQAGQSLPAWVCGLAFLAAGLSGQEVIGMGAWGARYGLWSAQLLTLGAVAAMVFLALFMMPLYYGSKARSVPEFLGLRFDRKTRTLAAGLFAAMTVFSSGISLYVVARVLQAASRFALSCRLRLCWLMFCWVASKAQFTTRCCSSSCWLRAFCRPCCWDCVLSVAGVD